MSDLQEIERLKAQFLTLHGDDLFNLASKTITDWEEDSTLSFDALVKACKQEPRVAVEVCPRLVEVGDLEHLRLFMYLLSDLWAANPELTKTLLTSALATSDRAARQLVEALYEDCCDPGHPLGAARKGFSPALRRLMAR